MFWRSEHDTFATILVKIIIGAVLTAIVFDAVLLGITWSSVKHNVDVERDDLAELVRKDNCLSEVNFDTFKNGMLPKNGITSPWATFNVSKMQVGDNIASGWDPSITNASCDAFTVRAISPNSGTSGTVKFSGGNLFGYANAPQQGTHIYVGVAAVLSVKLLMVPVPVKMIVSDHITVTGIRFYKNPVTLS